MAGSLGGASRPGPGTALATCRPSGRPERYRYDRRRTSGGGRRSDARNRTRERVRLRAARRAAAGDAARRRATAPGAGDRGQPGRHDPARRARQDAGQGPLPAATTARSRRRRSCETTIKIECGTVRVPQDPATTPARSRSTCRSRSSARPTDNAARPDRLPRGWPGRQRGRRHRPLDVPAHLAARRPGRDPHRPTRHRLLVAPACGATSSSSRCPTTRRRTRSSARASTA